MAGEAAALYLRKWPIENDIIIIASAFDSSIQSALKGWVTSPCGSGM